MLSSHIHCRVRVMAHVCKTLVQHKSIDEIYDKAFKLFKMAREYVTNPEAHKNHLRRLKWSKDCRRVCSCCVAILPNVQAPRAWFGAQFVVFSHQVSC